MGLNGYKIMPGAYLVEVSLVENRKNWRKWMKNNEGLLEVFTGWTVMLEIQWVTRLNKLL